MAWAVPVAMVASSIISNVLADGAARGDREAARDAADQAYAAIINAGYPPSMAQEVLKNQFKVMGVLTPELEKHIDVAPSVVAGIQENPQTLRDQQASLDALKLLKSQGLSMQDEVNFREARMKALQDAKSANQRLFQDFQARGMGGSGAQIAAQLINNQNAANAEADAGEKIAAARQQASQQALQQYINSLSNFREQNFNIDRARGEAQDTMNRFNTSNEIGRQQRNVSSQNSAQAANLQNAQNIANMNTQAQHAAVQTDWQNNLSRAQAIANARTGQSQMLQNRANQTAGEIQGIGGVVGSAIGQYAQNQQYNNLLDRFGNKTPSNPNFDYSASQNLPTLRDPNFGGNTNGY